MDYREPCVLRQPGLKSKWPQLREPCVVAGLAAGTLAVGTRGRATIPLCCSWAAPA